jgi:putative transposase
MLVQPKPPIIIKYATKLLETGLIKEKLSLEKLQEDTEDIKFQKKSRIQNEVIVMQESLQENKMETCSDKPSSSKGNIPIMKLSQILEADLTSKDKVSEKYWNNYSAEISEKLLFPPQIDLAALGQENSLDGFSNTLGPNLRYSTTNHMRILTKSSQKTYWKLLQSSPQDIMEDVNTQITRKVRIYPNKEQKSLFNKCFGAHRYFYNKAIEQTKLNEEIEDKKDRNYANSFISIRNKVVINDAELNEEDQNLWMKEIPYDTRQLAVKVMISAKKAALSNLRNGNIKKFNMRYISKKTSNNIFYIDKNALKNGKIFQRRLKENSFIKSKKDKKIIEKSEGDFSIIQEKDGRYYINVVIHSTEQILKKKRNICALDPGVRTFQTLYSQKSIGEFGFNTSKILYNLYRREDKLKSIIASKKLSSYKKYKLKKRCALLRTKIKHIVQDLHWKTADSLTKKFQVILLPIFNSKNMANKKQRKISKTSTRLLLGLSHYAFQQKLLYKAKQRGNTVILCKEHYTTKCCGKCGTLNEKIGGKKIFHCNNCNLTMDRDIHAARNILIRGLTLYSSSLSGTIQSVKKTPKIATKAMVIDLVL